MLPVAILTGAVFHVQVGYVSFLAPYLIFFMLFFTFLKLDTRHMKPTKVHGFLLAIQLLVPGIIYIVISPFDEVLAQGSMICVLAPTATAAAVITAMLGGSLSFLTTYVLLSSVLVAFFAPFYFSLINAGEALSFWSSFSFICRQVVPLLILPLLVALFIRKYLPVLGKHLSSFPMITFYLWAISLTIVTGGTVSFLVNQKDPDYRIEILTAIFSLAICIVQFLVGRALGKKYNNDPVSAGQGLGQKNTVLAIWMAQVYLNPIASVGPAAYVLWQNIINSWQLWKHDRKNLKTETL